MEDTLVINRLSFKISIVKHVSSIELLKVSRYLKLRFFTIEIKFVYILFALVKVLARFIVDKAIHTLHMFFQALIFKIMKVKASMIS